MAKKAKPKSKRTQVKDLAVEQQELTTDDAQKVKGSSGNNYLKIRGYDLSASQPTTTPSSTGVITKR